MVLKGNIETRRAHPAISHCSHLLLKCRMATNISQWLKVVQKLHFCEKVYFDQLLDFPILLLLFIVPYFTLWMLEFFNTIRTDGCQTVEILIRPDIMLGLIWVQPVCKGYQQAAKVTTSGQKDKYKTTC